MSWADLHGRPELASTVATLDRVDGPVLAPEVELRIRRERCQPYPPLRRPRPDDEEPDPAPRALDVLHLATSRDPHAAAHHAVRSLDRWLGPEERAAFPERVRHVLNRAVGMR